MMTNMAFWRKQNSEESEKIGGHQGWARVVSKQSAEEFRGSENALYGTRMADTCRYTFVQSHECEIPRVNHNVNYGLQAIMTC